MRPHVAVLTGGLFLALASVAWAAALDEFGGWAEHRLAPGAHMRIEEWRGGQWLVTPSGHPFIGVAIAHAHRTPPARRVEGDTTGEKFGDDLGTYLADRDRWLRQAGFNAFSYTTPEPGGVGWPWIATLPLLPAFISQGPSFVDLFGDAWRAAAVQRIESNVKRLAADRWLVGVSLGYPVLASPHMMPEWGWTRRQTERTNFLRALKALGPDAAGKRRYVAYLQEKYQDVEAWRRARGAAATSWSEALARDLGAGEDPMTLHADDADFYRQMWSEAVAFLAAEVRRAMPGTIVFAPRVIGMRRWPDPWLETWVRGVGSHVDAFLPELYGENAYREIVDWIGATTGRPSFVADGMRPAEFNYAGELGEAEEARRYEEMWTRLLGSKWFLGATVCEYRQQRPEFPWYARRPELGRLGVRNADYSERPAVAETLRRLHETKYEARLRLLAGPKE